VREAIAVVLVLILTVGLVYTIWRAVMAALRRPVGPRHPSWPLIAIGLVALFIGVGVVAPTEDESQDAADDSASSTRDQSGDPDTTDGTSTEAAPASTESAPAPSEGERRQLAAERRRAARRAARLRRQAAARQRAQARAEREARARRRAIRRERAERRAQREAQALQHERERNTQQLQEGATCDEIGVTDIPVVPGADIDADGDGIGCES
jgi:hypothetical protein